MFMLVWLLAILFINVSKCKPGFTPNLMNIKEMKNLAQFNDAQHRGPRWYDFSDLTKSASTLETEESTESAFSEYSETSSGTSEASSKETDSSKRDKNQYRSCFPCPHDMLKNFKNIGIDWICGSYQRARRSFKSECMMRYRNCQDGTMFVKMADRKCKDDEYHGKSWFYHYKV